MDFKIVILVIAISIQVFDVIREAIKTYKKEWHKVIIISLKSLVIVALGFFTYSDIQERKISATKGTFGGQKDASNHYPFLMLGNSTSYHNMHPIKFMGEDVDPINVSEKDNQIMISTYIRDSKGDILATIDGRTWEVTVKNGIDYNNDDSAFEIISLDQRVVFQVNIKKDTVLYQGMICSEYGECIFVDFKRPSIYYGKMPGTQRFIFPEHDTTKPLFKYPRYNFLGIRDVSANK